MSTATDRAATSSSRSMVWTSWVLAAIVLTGYLGGAVAAHLRVGDTARAAIPLVVGILAWGGLYLRDSRIRELIPFRGNETSSR